MRAHLFVSALFAMSLFGGAAMADRPSDDGGRTARMPIRDMHHVREQREVMQRETRVHVTPESRPRDIHVTERLRNRGDMVDRHTSRTMQPNNRASHNDAIKAQRDAAKAQRRLEEKKNQVINCAPNDEACGPGARSARVANQAAEKAAKQERDRQRAEIQKMVEKMRAEKLKAILQQKLCAKQGNLCAQIL